MTSSSISSGSDLQEQAKKSATSGCRRYQAVVLHAHQALQAILIALELIVMRDQ